ncbi:MAG: 16S rRNA (uracil(1498)-N(3))-methyltransferase [Nitrospirae bacterium]|nr:MAG: 16S rRNA (uracil(1498)-N(3))-methyltransferase [Nitrospirota bacterium]
MHAPARIVYPIGPAETSVEIKGETFHYIRHVLRLKQGERIILLDGRGGIYEAELVRITARSALLKILGPCQEPQRESPLKIVLVQSILKSQKMDLVLQKCTELGVNEFWPVVTERSEVRWTRKLPHWRAVVREATRQCRRAVVPEVREPMPLEEALRNVSQNALKLIFSEDASSEEWPKEKVSEAYILVGPEGGFSPDEQTLAKEYGFVTIRIGPRVLRAETASVVGSALVQFLYGDMHCVL